MKTAVMTDTNSGIMKAEADSMGIFLIPMPVIINDETHYEGIDLTETSFYESLTGGKNVSTSQPSPGDLMDLWDDIFEQGYDEIIHIPMSSGLSASCSSAISLSTDYEGKVQIADNHRISVTQRESVMHAKKLAEAGKSAKEIKEILEAEAYNSSIYIAVDTLEFLKKGGRVTAAGSAVGVGNLWRFPYLAAKDGGGLFLVIYLVLVLTFGFTLLTSDIAIGRRTGDDADFVFAVYGDFVFIYLFLSCPPVNCCRHEA